MVLTRQPQRQERAARKPPEKVARVGSKVAGGTETQWNGALISIRASVCSAHRTGHLRNRPASREESLGSRKLRRQERQ